METIKKIYIDPSTGLLGREEIYRKAKEQDKSISRKLVKEFFDKQYTTQMHKPIHNPKSYFPITATHENDVLELDLVDLKKISTKNKNVKWLFVAIDIFTRKGYVFTMKNKFKKSIEIAFTKLLKLVHPNKIICDNGKEFTNDRFVNICEDNNIVIDYVNINNHLIAHTGNRLGIVDKFIQTLRKRMHTYFDEYDTNKYIDVLDKLVENINNSYNSGIQGIPNEVNPLQIEQNMTQKLLDAIKTESKRQLNIGDTVRCVEDKDMFQKGSVPKWSNKIHVVEEVNAHSYKLDNGKWYKYYQLQKVEPTEKKKRKRLNEMKEIKRKDTIKRRLNVSGIDLSNITNKRRTKKPPQKLNDYIL